MTILDRHNAPPAGVTVQIVPSGQPVSGSGFGARFRRGWNAFRASRSGVVGLVLLAILVLMALTASLLSPADPNAIVDAPLLPPSLHHLMGTDGIGKDVLSNFLYGSRVALLVGASSAAIALVFGSLVGSLAGFYGGVVDGLLMRVAELFQVLPTLILAIVIVALLGAHEMFLIAAIAVTIWPQQARLVRAQVLSIRERDYVAASRAMGFGSRHIMFSEILPNALPPVVVQGALDVGTAILLEAGLSFIGLGDPSVPSWGQMLFNAQQNLENGWWITVFPGLGICLAVLAFNLVGDGINAALNPRVEGLRRFVGVTSVRRVAALVIGRRQGQKTASALLQGDSAGKS